MADGKLLYTAVMLNQLTKLKKKEEKGLGNFQTATQSASVAYGDDDAVESMIRLAAAD
jgi:hypothetical protein